MEPLVSGLDYSLFAGVTEYLRSALVWRHPVNSMKASER
jgi:hypothetical protein